MVSLRQELAGSVQEASRILGGLILLVLLVACANVAQLLLSRTTERHRELALRAALGASRGRLIQQLITESMALTAMAALLGLLVARWAVQTATAVAPAQLATQTYNILDFRVIGFAMGAALLIGIVFGVLPGALLSRLQPSECVLRTKTGAPDKRARQMRSWLAALQAGLTLILVASSVAMGRTFVQMLNADLGLRPSNVVTLSISMQGTKYRGGAAEWRYYNAVLDRLRAVPDVQAAGAVSYLPLANNAYMAGAFKLDSGQTVSPAVVNASMPGYFQADGTTLIAGRDFEPGERGEPAVIVNEAFARAAELGDAAAGHRLQSPWSKTPLLIVGVVATTRFAGPGYPGSLKSSSRWKESRHRRSRMSPGCAARPKVSWRKPRRPFAESIRKSPCMTLDQRLSDLLARPKFYTTATFFLAALAVLLAVVGTYGTASYSVAERKQEMGLRMALGASYPRVRGMVVRETLLPIVCGSAAGVIGASAAGQYLEHLIVSAHPVDSWTCTIGCALVLFAGFAAAWSATTRVLAIAPADALRAE